MLNNDLLFDMLIIYDAHKCEILLGLIAAAAVHTAYAFNFDCTHQFSGHFWSVAVRPRKRSAVAECTICLRLWLALCKCPFECIVSLVVLLCKWVKRINIAWWWTWFVRTPTANSCNDFCFVASVASRFVVGALTLWWMAKAQVIYAVDSSHDFLRLLLTAYLREHCEFQCAFQTFCSIVCFCWLNTATIP